MQAGSSWPPPARRVKNILGYSLSDLPLFMFPDEDGRKMWLCPVQPASASSRQLLQLPAAPQLEWVVPPPALHMPGGEPAWPNNRLPSPDCPLPEKGVKGPFYHQAWLGLYFSVMGKCYASACANSLPTESTLKGTVHSTFTQNREPSFRKIKSLTWGHTGEKSQNWTQGLPNPHSGLLLLFVCLFSRWGLSV